MTPTSIKVPLRQQFVEPLPIPLGYSVPRWSWLAWLLRKLGLLKPSYYSQHRIGMTTTTLRIDNLREFIYRYRGSLGEFYGWRISDLYVGREHFAQLVNIDAPTDGTGNWGMNLSIDVPMVFAKETGYGRVTCYGVRVHLVPWFDGILALPEHMVPGSVSVKIADVGPEPLGQVRDSRGWKNPPATMPDPERRGWH